MEPLADQRGGDLQGGTRSKPSRHKPLTRECLPPRKQALLQFSGSEQLAKLENLSKADKETLRLKEQILGEWQHKPMSAKTFLEYVKHYYSQTTTYPTLNR